MKLFEVTSNKIPPGSKFNGILFHGSNTEIKKFNRPPYGVFFSPHKGWASEYGDILTTAYVWAPKVYAVNYNDPFGEQILDALFDREYETLATYNKKLYEQGYYALQTQTDSEMICVFSNAKIYSAVTGEEM